VGNNAAPNGQVNMGIRQLPDGGFMILVLPDDFKPKNARDGEDGEDGDEEGESTSSGFADFVGSLFDEDDNDKDVPAPKPKPSEFKAPEAKAPEGNAGSFDDMMKRLGINVKSDDTQQPDKA
jgi:hypothetical protein